MRRSKSFIADKFFGPFDLKESNLRELFAIYDSNLKNVDQTAPEYEEWRSKLLEVIPRLNHDVLIDFALYLSYEAKLNDRFIWQALEDAAYPVLHHLSLA